MNTGVEFGTQRRALSLCAERFLERVKEKEKIRFLLGLLALALGLMAFSGCKRFVVLKADIADWTESHRLVLRLEGEAIEAAGAYVALWVEGENGMLAIQDVTRVDVSGRAAFLLRDRQRYFVGAFKDLDGDAKVDDGEPIWYYGTGGPKPIPKASEDFAEFSVLEILRRPSPHRKTLEGLRRALDGRALMEAASGQSVNLVTGDVAELTDPRFSIEIGDQGLWEPTRFLREHGVGVFFLQPYRPEATPVLFVNGASGTPHNFTWIIDNLDTKRYQPCVFFCPSGLSLEESARILDKVMGLVTAENDIGRIAVVAHSMGGLTARRYVQLAQERDYEVAALITISTPWNGHLMARLGAEYAPEPVPSWIDMQPDSPFISELLDQPPAAPHLLLYGVDAKKSFFLPDRNDGTVSVESMIDQRALEGTTAVIALPKDHIAILKSEMAMDAIEAHLDRFVYSEAAVRLQAKQGHRAGSSTIISTQFRQAGLSFIRGLVVEN